MIRSCTSSLVSTLRHGTSFNAKLVNQHGNSYFTRLSFSTSPTSHDTNDPLNQLTYIEDNLKLDIKEEGDVTRIEANPVDTGRSRHLVKVDHETACVLCRLDLRNLDYTDVLILSQFIKRNGSIVTYHESKLCTKQYLRVIDLIKKAQRCNLIQRPPDYLVPGPWHDLNTYLEPNRRRDQPMKVIKKEYWKI